MFTIAKADGSLQSLADLRKANKAIKRTPFPLPKTADMLQKLEGCFMYATSLDLNMGYSHMRLTQFSSRFCTSATLRKIRVLLITYGIKYQPRCLSEEDE